MKLNHTPNRPNPLYIGALPPFNPEKACGPGEPTDQLRPPADHGEESYTGHQQLADCVALIVGGDSGIGRAISLAYAREGASIAFTYHQNQHDAEVTSKLLQQEHGVRSQVYQLDQSNANDCKNLLQQVVNDYGRLDILVNNAATQTTYQSIDSIEIEDFESTFHVNAFGTFYLCKYALEHIKEGGCIINTASIQSFDASAYLLPYAATKAAIASMTKSFASFAIQRGIRVNAVAPGPVWTPLIPNTMPKDKVKHFGSNTLLGRPAQPAELAPVYVFLASAQASYVTGEIYPATGGRQQM
ncbi:SDR family oxidoreductase [Coraliomargarita sp. SDUM461004]|uniref:SDR family oxidoreductase n=1 Tax=Thalassobacterium sedimentorum TaxID=3041258 RepID=A0ABU1AJ86_9BACT|nr:SDR family oxidoreductase [Coraliomargarita sp. SDUM461004]MDQ8194885.1 SDR family oxidoreductase [Coraliomargarita sp. SDUM461004]